LELIDNDGHGCRLVVNKAKLNTDDGLPADKIIATGISRTIVYDNDGENCDVKHITDYTIAKGAGDSTPLNMQLLRLSNDTDGDDGSVSFDGTLSLSSFISAIAGKYQKRLVELDTSWGKQAKLYIEQIDAKARTILSQLADQLAQCEFNLPATEYCITFKACSTSEPPPPPSSPSVSAAQAMARQQIVNKQTGKMNFGTRKWGIKA
jgi:hypothetical protein